MGENIPKDIQMKGCPIVWVKCRICKCANIYWVDKQQLMGRPGRQPDEKKVFLNVLGWHSTYPAVSLTDFSKRKTLKQDKRSDRKKTKENLKICPSFVFSLLQSWSLCPNDYSSSVCRVQYKNIRWWSWFAGKRERNCFWAAGTSLNTSLSFSQAWLMLPVFLDSWSHLQAGSLKSRAVRQWDAVLSPFLLRYPQPSHDSSSPLPSLILHIQWASTAPPPLFWQVL